MAPEDDGPEKGRLSLSRPSRLHVMTMYLKYEVREVREKALSRSSDVDPRLRSVNSLRSVVEMRRSRPFIPVNVGRCAY